MLNHAVCVFGSRIETWLVAVLGAHMGAEVHPRRIHPAKERLVGAHLPLHEVDRRGGGLVIDCLHALLGKRAGIFDGLPADPAEPRLFSWIVAIRGLAA